MALKKSDPIAVSEREAIHNIRRVYPNMGAYRLAKLIANYDHPALYSVSMVDLSRAAFRPYYSILSVIRRYDQKTLETARCSTKLPSAALA